MTLTDAISSFKTSIKSSTGYKQKNIFDGGASRLSGFNKVQNAHPVSDTNSNASSMI